MFQNLPLLKPDALMLVSQRFRADPREHKLDLGVGVYRDADGNASILQTIKQAEAKLLEQQMSKAYLPADGDKDFVRLMRQMVLGNDAPALADHRVAAAQCPGGTGSLHQAMALLKKAGNAPVVWVGTPTWPNHIPMLQHHRFEIRTYDYFDLATQSLQFDRMMSALGEAKAGDVVLLHGVCHNPTGADLDQSQWAALTNLVEARSLVPLFDFAYQGFGQGSHEDATGVRMMAERLPEMLIAASCSKSFGLYRERTGILLVLCENSAQATATTGALQTLARVNFSNPPAHGAELVRIILSDAGLTEQWATELQQMRERVGEIRTALVAEAEEQSLDIGYVATQTGLFTTFALSEDQTSRLADEHAIHMPGTGRINMSGLSLADLPGFVTALKETGLD
ncbi:aspartate aminotransferase [Parasphingorhabdus marina DSM 22363]|uniref:Aspartate aminotransferase n=1 Tax=Parasphingorhabdus marina DSM 22363 TaxID=1123272 RepID=A0A1N6DC98_9SPHN|nr:amino acid aminotransferase [Parasphingorhabdus marina]SIN68306.1 aspartate aminotransferase [Parasphingorhabdus marina DSM 22363]